MSAVVSVCLIQLYINLTFTFSLKFVSLLLAPVALVYICRLPWQRLEQEGHLKTCILMIFCFINSGPVNQILAWDLICLLFLFFYSYIFVAINGCAEKSKAYFKHFLVICHHVLHTVCPLQPVNICSLFPVWQHTVFPQVNFISFCVWN